mmetsp:Transcript_13370/g.38532  ORF Transcript_13370/g.38532 Transcript_13370/m.38532 type:complete len:253 (-) Transcript_13370:873-1631(-)
MRFCTTGLESLKSSTNTPTSTHVRSTLTATSQTAAPGLLFSPALPFTALPPPCCCCCSRDFLCLSVVVFLASASGGVSCAPPLVLSSLPAAVVRLRCRSWPVGVTENAVGSLAGPGGCSSPEACVEWVWLDLADGMAGRGGGGGGDLPDVSWRTRSTVALGKRKLSERSSKQKIAGRIVSQLRNERLPDTMSIIWKRIWTAPPRSRHCRSGMSRLKDRQHSTMWLTNVSAQWNSCGLWCRYHETGFGTGCVW